MKPTLSHDNKFRIAFDYLIENKSYNEIGKNIDKPAHIIQDFINELSNDPIKRMQYLPNYKKPNALNESKFGGYYEKIPEMEIGEIPVYTDTDHVSDTYFERRSFSERLKQRIY